MSDIYNDNSNCSEAPVSFVRCVATKQRCNGARHINMENDTAVTMRRCNAAKRTNEVSFQLDRIGTSIKCKCQNVNVLLIYQISCVALFN